MNPRTTLLVGQWFQPTGMARVLRAMARGLAQRRTVHVLAIDPSHGAQDRVECDLAARDGVTLHCNQSEIDPFAERSIGETSASCAPSSILLYHDPWFVGRMRRSIRGSDGVVAAYCPLDGVLIRSSVRDELVGFDAVFVPTRFAAQQLVDRARDETLDRFVVPHGIDEDFRRCAALPNTPEDRHAARNAIAPLQPHASNGFWVLNVNRNHARKRLAITVRGFADFYHHSGRDAWLCVPWGQERTGPDVVRLADSLGIGDRLIRLDRTGLATAELNTLYAASSVGVNTATGEGWGLPAFEHAAAGAPQIVPDHSACAELWREHAVLLPVRRSLTLAGVVEGGEVSAEDLSRALSRLAGDAKHYAQLQASAYERSGDPMLRWSSVCELWHQRLNELENTVPPTRTGRERTR